MEITEDNSFLDNNITTEPYLVFMNQVLFWRAEDLIEFAHLILIKLSKPSVAICGIFGNILNIIILYKYKALRNSTARSFLIAMSAMDLSQLVCTTISAILEWVAIRSHIVDQISVFYGCYIEYDFQTNIFYV